MLHSNPRGRGRGAAVGLALLTVVWPEHRTYRPSPVVTIDTDAPAPALQALAAYAATVDAKLTVWAAELDRLTQALGRVVDAVGG